MQQLSTIRGSGVRINEEKVKTTTTESDDFDRFSGSGLNANLTKATNYQLVIRNAGSSNWPYASFYAFVGGVGSGGARLSWKKDANDLNSYVDDTEISLSDSEGSPHKPWFRVSQ